MSKINVNQLYDYLLENGISYFCGVPDSVLNPFISYLEANDKSNNTIAVNEGSAIGLAIGYNISTDKIPLVYMQNSGIGNATDPLVSLASPTVFSVPILLLIGWRGQPGKHDEPQHIHQGEITPKLLDDLGIPSQILSYDIDAAKLQIKSIINEMKKTDKPHALLIESDTFDEYINNSTSKSNHQLSREEAVSVIAESINDKDIIVSSIGKMSRELFEYRDKKNQKHNKDLLIVGGMGHAASVAAGIALQKQKLRVFCLDGDGSIIMHMGVLTTIGTNKPNNFTHVVLNNGLHDSVGGQPSSGLKIDLKSIVLGCGYRKYYKVTNKKELKNVIKKTESIKGPIMIEVLIKPGARKALVRPNIHPRENKTTFQSFIKKGI
jgi:phosphonopyruvate decarboxylase